MSAHLAAAFFGGAFLANALPHLAAGTMGRRFQSPFAKPPGRGLSSPIVNVLWGFANVVAGCLLAWGVADVRLSEPVQAATALAGGLAIALHLAHHFGRIYNPPPEKG